MASRFSTRLLRLLAAIILALAGASPLIAQPRGPLGEIPLKSPRFAATAVGFKSLDETHWYWMGSDEILVVLVDFDSRIDTALPVFGDVDEGESRTITTANSCIAPSGKCGGGAKSLHFGAALWEYDGNLPILTDFCRGSLPGGLDYYLHGSCNSNDDLIGRFEVNLTQDDLLALLPQVGNSLVRTIRLDDHAGVYNFTYRITRLADVERTIVIHEPPVPPVSPPSIALTLSKDLATDSITLAWTGATTANIDIYRNGTLLTTTANDGSFTETVSNGTYQYRVCEAGSTAACSATQQISLP